jgi:MFS family permease
VKISTAYRMLALMTGAQIGGAVVQQGLGSLAPTFVATFGLSNAQLGVVFTSLSLGSAVFTIGAGLVVDRVGERPVVLWGGVALGLTLCAAAAVPWYPWLCFWIFLFGISYASQTPAGGRAILAWFDRDRGLAMSIRQAGVPLGGAIGSTILPLIAVHASYRWSLVTGAALGTGAAVVASIFYVDAPRAAGTTPRFRDIARRMLVLARDPLTILFTVTCMVLSAGQGITNGFFVLTAVHIVHLSPVAAGGIFAFAQICAVAGRIVWGRLSDAVFHGDRAWPLVCIAAILATAAYVLPHVGPGDVVVLALVGGALGISAAGWNGVFATAMAEIGGAELAGSVLGLGLTFIFLSLAAAPSLFGALADRTSLQLAWTVFGAVATLGIIPPLLAVREGRARRNA